MTTPARMMRKETEGEPRCNAAAASLERDISAWHMKFNDCMAEIRSTISRVTWRRSVQGVMEQKEKTKGNEQQAAYARECIVKSVKASSR